MKISHIILLIIIAVAIGVIISTSGDASKYVTFKEAKEIALDKMTKNRDGLLRNGNTDTTELDRRLNEAQRNYADEQVLLDKEKAKSDAATSQMSPAQKRQFSGK